MRGKEETLQLLKGRHLGTEVMLATVSGVATTKPALIRFADDHMGSIGLITTKSFQIDPNPGNREPVITEVSPGCFGNSVGLRNPGLEASLRELQQLRAEHEMRALLNVSVSASDPEDFIVLVRAFEEVSDIIELNFSCPHAAEGYGASIGCSREIASEYMRRIREAVGEDFSSLIIPKLTPNTDEIGQIAASLIAAGADGLAAVNTVGPEVYLEEHSGAPVLNNKLGGKGGKSGLWIRERALEVLREIRSAVGDEIPILGMGGVSNGADAAAMIQAGADTVGLGSIFGRVHQRSWEAFTDALASDAQHQLISESPEDSSSEYLRGDNQMQFTPCRITKTVEHASGVKVLYTDGRLDCGPGQYAFIWLPEVGEKPFSIAESDPLTFIIKERGPFTRELISCEEGDTLYVRGVYGESVEIADTKKAVILAGGTGIAVVPSLAKRLEAAGVEMSFYYGSSLEEKEPLLGEELSAYGSYTAAADDGVPGRVIDVLEQQICSVEDTAFYTIGPEVFMSRAARIMSQKGIADSRIFLSMERPSMCGIGMCGECACGDRLTCQYGTFVRLDFLKEHAPELL